MNLRRLVATFLAFFVLFSTNIAAEDRIGLLRLLPADAVTEKTIGVGGGTLAYTATAGTLTLHDQNGEKSAAIFYTAYVAKGTANATRPVTFAFNGGPGAASAYLHLGLAGPRVITFGDQGNDGAHARLVDNPETWLAFTDLVFIDPVATGWSRTAKPDAAAGFFSVRRDTEAMAKVIALYVTANRRTASPKYLLGESYGGFRAAKVARALQNQQGIVASGIIMVSPMLEASWQWASTSNALAAALRFPSIAAAHLDRMGAYTPEKMAEIERFAITEYLTTLAGPPLSGERAKEFYARVSQFTGVPVEAVERGRGLVSGLVTMHMRQSGRVPSAYDGSITAPDPYPESEGRRGGDPVLDGFTRALSGTFAAYARHELGFETDMTYVLLADGVAGKWDWGTSGRTLPGVSDDLRNLLALDPSFRLLVVHGRSDLVTPHGVSRYVLDQIPPIGGPGRLALKVYAGGHMFYLDPQARRDFARDAAEFIAVRP